MEEISLSADGSRRSRTLVIPLYFGKILVASQEKGFGTENVRERGPAAWD